MSAARNLARLAMIGATVTWGVTFVVVQRAIEDLPVFHLLAFRFGIGALLLAPLLGRGGVPARLWRLALPAGIALFIGFSLQTWGLVWTTPSRSAFLTGLAVLLVPLLAWAAQGRRLGARSLVGAALAVAGLYLLLDPGAGGLGLGELLTAACAVAFAFHILSVERALPGVGVAPLTVAQFAIVALLSAPSLLLEPPTAAQFTPYALSAILITGVLATAGAFLCQVWAQSHLTASETAVFLALEPVAAAAYSVAAGAERLTVAAGIGGALIVAGMILGQLAEAPTPAPADRP